MLALDYLPLIALGIVLGFLGQSIRALIGLRKVFYVSKNLKFNQLFNLKHLVVTMLISLVVGCLGVLAICQDFDDPFVGHQIILLIAIGYTGTDIIEGLLFPKLLNKMNNEGKLDSAD